MKRIRYFFGPRVSGADEVQIHSLAPDRALLVGMFGDLELVRGGWRTVDAPRHPYDRLTGAGALEIRLTKTINEGQPIQKR